MFSAPSFFLEEIEYYKQQLWFHKKLIYNMKKYNMLYIVYNSDINYIQHVIC